MAIEKFLPIASFAISVSGLILALLSENRRKKVALVVVVIVLVGATTGATVYQDYQHNQLVRRVEKEIIAKLNGNTWTFERLYQELFCPSWPVVTEALFRAVEKGVIGHKVMEVRINYEFQQVRVYYVKSLQ